VTLRFWARILPVASGAAALLGAAQFGVLHGLGMLRLDRDFYAGTDNEWNAQLTWVAWLALTSTVGGAAYAVHVAKRDRKVGFPTRGVVALAAALGAALTVVSLTAPSARFAKLNASFDPLLTAAIAASAAVVGGLIVALLTVDNPPLSTNLVWTVAMVWIVAIPSFLDTVKYGLSYDPETGYLDPIRLGVLDIGQLDWQQRARFSLPAIALVCGLAVALVARMQGRSRIQIALSGAVGPTLVALAYLIGGPGISRDHTYQADAYVGALAAVVVGLLASVLVAVLKTGKAKSKAREPIRELAKADA
jgi:hypothetical protein